MSSWIEPADPDRLRLVVPPPYPLDGPTRAKVRALARAYLKAELPRLEAERLMPEPEHDSPWIDHERLWRRRRPGRDDGAELAKKLEALLPGRWTGPASSPRAEEIVEGLLRGCVAALTVNRFRFDPFGERDWKPIDPRKAIDEFLELIEHPEQTWRVMRLVLDVDSRAVDGRSVHDVRIPSVRGLTETISPELPEGVKASDTVPSAMRGSHEPRTFLIVDRPGRDGWFVAFDARPHMIHASLALRLVTAGTSVDTLELYGQPRMVHVGGPSAQPVDYESGAHYRRVGVVAPGQLAGLEAIATQICALDARAKDKIPPAMLVACNRFLRSHRAAAWGDVVIDIAIALEAALSTGEKDEITLRVKTRAANLLARPGDPPAAIFADVGELLRIRGKVAHGEPIPQNRWQDLYAARGLDQVMVEDRLAVLFDRWRDLVRRAILARLLLDVAGLWRIGTAPERGVDEALIDPTRRRDWRRAIRRRATELGIPTSIDKPPPLRDTLHEPYSEGMEH
jgi:hypothetical protein